jgi:hypothetical protein
MGYQPQMVVGAIAQRQFWRTGDFGQHSDGTIRLLLNDAEAFPRQVQHEFLTNTFI